MALLLTSPTNPGLAQWLPAGSVAGITPYMVGVDPDLDYTTIQSAIDAAAADGHEDADNPAVVLVRAGRYAENVTMRRGIFLQGVPTVPQGVTITGAGGPSAVMTIDISDGGGPIEKNVTGMSGISIESTGQVGLHFTGITPQVFLGQVVYLAATVGGQAMLVDNTGVRITRSAVVIEALRMGGTATASSPLVEVTAAQLLMDDFIDQIEDQSMVCLQTSGIGNVVVSTGLLQGGVRLEDAAPEPDVLGQVVITSTPPREGLFIGPGGARLASGDITLIGGVTPNVVGTGTLVLGASVSFIFGGAEFDPALTLSHAPAGMPDTYYTPGSPAATAAWAAPVPVTQEEAIDRLAIQVAVLGGPIP